MREKEVVYHSTKNFRVTSLIYKQLHVLFYLRPPRKASAKLNCNYARYILAINYNICEKNIDLAKPEEHDLLALIEIRMNVHHEVCM